MFPGHGPLFNKSGPETRGGTGGRCQTEMENSALPRFRNDDIFWLGKE